MAYTPYYPNGWQSGEEGATPITPDALNYMERGIQEALPLSGGTLTGVLKLTENIHYGTALPSAGQKGRIFFKKVT